MKVTVLMENYAPGAGFVAEHGFSCLIETDSGEAILFDTGPSGNFIRNAEILSIDLSSVTCAAISHGHYDHTGGLPAFLDTNGRASIYAKPQIVHPKFRGKRSIGLPFDSGRLNGRLIPCEKTVEIHADVFLLPDIELFHPGETRFENFTVRIENQPKPDVFLDELFLVIRHSDSISIITGCSHRGVTNIIETAQKNFQLPVRNLIGGFHLKRLETVEMDGVMERIASYDIGTIATGHCTGIEGFALLKAKLGNRVLYAHTGKTIEL